jgi:hypothetical protein
MPLFKSNERFLTTCEAIPKTEVIHKPGVKPYT